MVLESKYLSVLILFCLAFCFSPVAAQEGDHQVGLAVGGVYHQVRENLIAPLRWDGYGPVIDTWYAFSKNNSRHHLELMAPFSFPKNRFGHEAWTWEIYFGYSYLHRTINSEKFGQLYIGAVLDWTATGQEYINWDDSHTYWFNAYELGPSLRYVHEIGLKHIFSTRIDIPFIALASRPPHYRYIDQEPDGYWIKHSHDDMQFTSFHEYVSLSLRLEYDYKVNRAFTIGLAYLFRYKTFSRPVSISGLSNNLLLKIAYTPRRSKIEKQ